VLNSFENVVLFHGHEHVGYRARTGLCTVISGPSVACGDTRSGPNCVVYGISPSGDVSVVETLRTFVAFR
jgi:hypothetical protein